MRFLHHGSSSQRGIILAGPAAENGRGTLSEAVWLALMLTSRANKTLRPLHVLKIFRARCIIREKLLELRERPGERGLVHIIIMSALSCFGN
jgi:hypothetical protein